LCIEPTQADAQNRRKALFAIAYRYVSSTLAESGRFPATLWQLVGMARDPLLLCRVVRRRIPQPDNCIRLRALLTLDDVELNIIALFKRFIAIQLNCRVVDEYIWSVIASDESVALGVVEPLDFAFVLSHRVPFLHLF